MSLHSSKKQAITLGSIVGGGGEAQIYFVQQHSDMVAKVYMPAPRSGADEKIKWMIANPPQDPSAKLGHRSIAWPSDVLFNQRGQFVGYLMPRIRDAAVILNLFNPKLRHETGLDFNWQYLHRIAHNLAAAIDAIHNHDYVIGDLNEGNVLVTRTALVTLIDTDSFQVRAHSIRGNKVFRCTVGKPDYTPPELQGKNFASVDRQPANDRFGLGVLIFQLLVQGNHPFRSRWLGAGDAPSTSTKISNGWFPYDKSFSSFILPPPDMPSLEVLHPKVAKLFNSCFVAGHHNPQQRPQPKEWADILDEAEQALKQCDRCGNFFSGHLKQCSWCATQRPLPPAQPRSNKSSTSSQSKTSPSKPPTPPSKPSRGQPPPRKPPRLGCSRLLILLMIVAAIAYFGRPYYDGLIAQAMPTISQMLPRLAEISPNIAVPTLDINVPIIASPTKEDATTKTLPSLIRFDIPCKASMLVRRTDGSVVSWAMDMRVVSVEVLQDTLKLNFEIVRTGSTQQQWSPVNANDIKLKTETGRFLLKTEDGASDLFTQNTTLRPNEVHQGWLAFDQPDRGVFELVHPNVKPRFLIDLTHRQCQTI